MHNVIIAVASSQVGQVFTGPLFSIYAGVATIFNDQFSHSWSKGPQISCVHLITLQLFATGLHMRLKHTSMLTERYTSFAYSWSYWGSRGLIGCVNYNNYFVYLLSRVAYLFTSMTS